MSPEPLYELRDLELRYGPLIAFSAARLDIAAGERLALLGANGSGKTTLLKALNGLLAPSCGTLRFAGQDAAASSQLRRRSVYLHQHPYLFAGTAAYNVRFGCRARGLRSAEAKARAGAAMAELALQGFDGRRRFSGGETQRVALARALAVGADVLLVDEPTASADAASRELILAALARAAEAGATIVLATHDGSLADRIASRALVLEQGRVIEDRGTGR